MTQYGLLSDSHGQAARTGRAAQILIDAGARTLLHLGDLGSAEVIDALAVASKMRRVEARIVFGNVDANIAALARHAREAGLIVDHPMGWLEPAGGDLVYLHGDDADDKRTALAAEVRYLCHGHTHVRLDQRDGKTRVINPGALCRAAGYSVALLDTGRDTLTFFPVT